MTSGSFQSNLNFLNSKSFDSRRASHSNSSDPLDNEGVWTFRVSCFHIEPAQDSDSDTVQIEVNGVAQRVAATPADIEALLEPYASVQILACSEWREKFWEYQWGVQLLYHSMVLLEIQGGIVLSTEKYNDKLELMLGDAEIMNSFAKNFRSSCDKRSTTVLYSRTELDTCITVRDLLMWISGPLAKVWQPYRLLSANCQHYTEDLQQFLKDPTKVEELRRDRQLVLPAVQRCGLHLQFAAEELRMNPEIVLAAITENGLALQFAMSKLQRNRMIVLAAVRNDGFALRFASEDLRGDREIALAAVQQTGMSLEFCTEELRADREVVLAGVRRDGLALQFANEALTEEHEVVLTAVRQNGLALQFAAEKLKMEREVVSTAIFKNGMALEFASEELQRDRDLVLVCVDGNGLALQFAGEELKRDRKVVFAALRKNGMALEYAAKELKGDREFVIAAVRWDGFTLHFAAEELKRDREVVLAATM